MSILVVAAHPDDEVLGSGGTISRWAREGEEVSVHIFGEGGTSRNERVRGDDRLGLEHDALEANRILGASKVVFHALPDNRFDSVALLEIVHEVEKAIREESPRKILTHSVSDLNVDHRTLAQAVITATRPLSSNLVAEVFSFEVLSATEWSFGVFGSYNPNFYVELSEQDLERKVSALECYKSEIRRAPHPRSSDVVRALAKLRGSTVGVTYAESFEVIRQVRKL